MNQDFMLVTIFLYSGLYIYTRTLIQSCSFGILYICIYIYIIFKHCMQVRIKCSRIRVTGLIETSMPSGRRYSCLISRLIYVLAIMHSQSETATCRLNVNLEEPWRTLLISWCWANFKVLSR